MERIMARDAALIFSYGEPFPGRESDAVKLMSQALGLLQSRPGVPEYYTAADNSADFLMIRGRSDELMQFRESNDTQDFLNKLSAVVRDLRVNLYYGGPASGGELEQGRLRYAQALSEMGYVSQDEAAQELTWPEAWARS